MQRIRRNCCEQLYANKLANLEGADKFLETYHLPRLNCEEIESLNRQISSKEIESEIKNYPTNRSPGPSGFIGEFYQALKEDEICILLKLFSKIQLIL